MTLKLTDKHDNIETWHNVKTFDVHVAATLMSVHFVLTDGRVGWRYVVAVEVL